MTTQNLSGWVHNPTTGKMERQPITTWTPTTQTFNQQPQQVQQTQQPTSGYGSQQFQPNPAHIQPANNQTPAQRLTAYRQYPADASGYGMTAAQRSATPQLSFEQGARIQSGHVNPQQGMSAQERILASPEHQAAMQQYRQQQQAIHDARQQLISQWRQSQPGADWDSLTDRLGWTGGPEDIRQPNRAWEQLAPHQRLAANQAARGSGTGHAQRMAHAAPQAHHAPPFQIPDWSAMMQQYTPFLNYYMQQQPQMPQMPQGQMSAPWQRFMGNFGGWR
jgi:hypothetical protein